MLLDYNIPDVTKNYWITRHRMSQDVIGLQAKVPDDVTK